MKLVEKEKRRKKKGKRLKWQIAKDEMSLVVRVVRGVDERVDLYR